MTLGRGSLSWRGVGFQPSRWLGFVKQMDDRGSLPLWAYPHRRRGDHHRCCEISKIKISLICFLNIFVQPCQNETKHFEIRLERAGVRTCVSVQLIENGPTTYYGNWESCVIRNRQLTPAEVQPFDYNLKTISTSYIYP